MKRIKQLILTLAVLAMPAVTWAGFSIGGGEITGSGSGYIQPNAITLSFSQESTDNVLVSISLTNDIRFWDKLAIINLNTNNVKVSNVVAIDGAALNAWEYLEDGIEAPQSPSPKFDLRFDFQPPGLFPITTAVYRVTGSGLLAENFEQEWSTIGTAVASNPSISVLGVAHILHGPNGDKSGWYGSTGGGDDLTDVPEPTSVALWSLGALAGVVARRRRQKSA